MQLSRWRNLFMLKNSLLPSLSNPTTTTHFASIHSTSSTSEKRKNWDSRDANRLNCPSKDHSRYVIRQKRADAKKALNDFLYRTGCSNSSFVDEDRLPKYGPGTENKKKGVMQDEDRLPKYGPRTENKKKGRSFAQHGSKSQHKKTKRKFRKYSFTEDFDEREPETVFEATFGNRWYTWSFKFSSFQYSTSGFEWRDEPNWENRKTRQWNSTRNTESEYNSYSVGSRSDRIILGLPPTGALKIEEVKNAFRMSALKWHPDKHQGCSSQETAGEKFKQCVNAYKSLCSALS